MRWINRFGTAMIVFLLVAGPPLAATAWIVHVGPVSPTLHQLRTWLRQPLTPGAVVAGFIAVAMAGWLLVLSDLARQASRSLRYRRRRRHLHMPSPAQLTASSMAGFAALTLPGVHAGHPVPPAAASTSPEPPVTPAPPYRIPDGQLGAGVDLPGGNWLPTSTALAVAATASAIWLHRRQSYRPQPPHLMRLTRDDDLQPLPPTADAITATVTGEHLLAGRNDTPALTIDQLPAGIVYLDGPGAAYAARGIIVSTALAAATGQPTRLLHLHPDDLAALLPEIDPLDLDAAGIERSPEPTDPQQTTIRIIPDPAATVHWQTDRDGITTGTGLAAPQRLCMLGPRAANDLLILVRHALVQPSESAPPTSPHNQNRPPVATLPADLPAPASLRLIGRCELSVAGRPIRIRRNAGLQILAYLAIHPQGASKAELIRACWPQQPPATITQRLHTTISDLRNQLRPLVNADPVTRNGEHYQLNQNVIDTDLRAWRNTTRAAAHAPDGATRIRASHELIALYQGELAAGHHWPWLQAAREALRRDVVDAYTAVADHTADPEAAELLAQALAVDAQNQDLPQRPMRHQ